MFYTIYKITNILDGKIYIGKHQTKNINDKYMGSGKQLKRAQSKHGIENFKKEILFQFDNEAEMNAKEAELVTEEFCLREDTYNLCPGGKGGWGYINNEYWNETTNQIRINNLLSMTKIQRAANGLKTSQLNRGKKKSNGRLGTKLTEETKQKLRKPKTQTSNYLGKTNSQFGTMWITNGQENKKIKKDVDIIPEGWYKGRITLLTV